MVCAIYITTGIILDFSLCAQVSLATAHLINYFTQIELITSRSILCAQESILYHRTNICLRKNHSIEPLSNAQRTHQYTLKSYLVELSIAQPLANKTSTHFSLHTTSAHSKHQLSYCLTSASNHKKDYLHLEHNGPDLMMISSINYHHILEPMIILCSNYISDPSNLEPSGSAAPESPTLIPIFGNLKIMRGGR